MDRFDVIVIGSGAAGMMCAVEAGKRGRSVLVVDHANVAGEKIRISGGGRCNFTNLHVGSNTFESKNPRFCISALRRYTPKDFVALVDRHQIAWHEKTLGQLFCDGAATQIVDMFRREMQQAGVTLRLGRSAKDIVKTSTGFQLVVGDIPTTCQSLVIATGGKSIPKMGATGFGYDVAQQFGLNVVTTRPALVPLTFEIGLLERLKPLAGVAVDVTVASGKTRFKEAMLFTHRGLSGPAILQISTYWREGQELQIDMAPGVELFAALREARMENGRQAVQTVLGRYTPRRLAQVMIEAHGGAGNIADTKDKVLKAIAQSVNAWRVKPVGSEGYRTAEVTLGGVDTDELDQRTFVSKAVPGLYFIGEVVDVTGWLGGYNFQWAWASGWCAGQAA